MKASLFYFSLQCTAVLTYKSLFHKKAIASQNLNVDQ
jgi:hypothetical protein